MKRPSSPSTKPLRSTPLGLDKRYSERVAIICPVQYAGEVLTQPHKGEGVTKDISLAGCKMISEHPVTRGTLLSLTIALPDGDAPLKLTSVHVVWVSGCHFAVRFMQLGQSDRKRIQAFLWKNITHDTVHNQRARFRLV
ncbi:MAG: PilZ domain-containing protein [Nitrospira sp.]|nr:MAG: PilZ domain-containing protein [Nitrospira sp.]